MTEEIQEEEEDQEGYTPWACRLVGFSARELIVTRPHPRPQRRRRTWALMSHFHHHVQLGSFSSSLKPAGVQAGRLYDVEE